MSLKRTTAILCAMIALSGVNATKAGPSEKALAPVKENLSKKIAPQYLDAPLDKVLDQLQREAGVPVVLDRQHLQGRERTPVSLQASEMEIRRVLDWVTRMAGVDWDVRDGVVFVSTQREVLKPYITLEVYDVRSLTVSPPRFTGAPELALNQALSNTSSGGSGAGAQSATTLFGEAEEVDMQGLEGDELVRLIESTVDQASWDSYGAETGASARFNNGLLLVKHTPEVQAKVRNLLQKYQDAAGKMVSFEARFLLVRTDALDRLLDANDGILVLKPEGARDFVKNAGPLNAGVRVLGAARTVCMNAQRVYVSSEQGKAFLSDVEPVSGGVGVDPTLSVLSDGNMVDVEPAISFDNRQITLTLRGTVTAGQTSSTTAIPAGGLDSVSLDFSDRTQTVTGKDGKATRVTVGNGSTPVVAAAALGLPEQDLVRFATTVRVADGGAVVLSGISSQFTQIKGENAEVVLFLRARVIESLADTDRQQNDDAPGEEAPGEDAPDPADAKQ